MLWGFGQKKLQINISTNEIVNMGFHSIYFINEHYDSTFKDQNSLCLSSFG